MLIAGAAAHVHLVEGQRDHRRTIGGLEALEQLGGRLGGLRVAHVRQDGAQVRRAVRRRRRLHRAVRGCRLQLGGDGRESVELRRREVALGSEDGVRLGQDGRLDAVGLAQRRDEARLRRAAEEQLRRVREHHLGLPAKLLALLHLEPLALGPAQPLEELAEEVGHLARARGLAREGEDDGLVCGELEHRGERGLRQVEEALRRALHLLEPPLAVGLLARRLRVPRRRVGHLVLPALDVGQPAESVVEQEDHLLDQRRAELAEGGHLRSGGRARARRARA
mmetsp:Transcript_7528/g.18731  ORF Transcript_7528/g.18731 Transcript_7528/m.18731 type:complete len:280 (-) Transcript_7528:55-894(-)